MEQNISTQQLVLSYPKTRLLQPDCRQISHLILSYATFPKEQMNKDIQGSY
jgi:hypothetical protein